MSAVCSVAMLAVLTAVAIVAWGAFAGVIELLIGNAIMKYSSASHAAAIGAVGGAILHIAVAVAVAFLPFLKDILHIIGALSPIALGPAAGALGAAILGGLSITHAAIAGVVGGAICVASLIALNVVLYFCCGITALAWFGSKGRSSDIIV